MLTELSFGVNASEFEMYFSEFWRGGWLKLERKKSLEHQRHASSFALQWHHCIFSSNRYMQSKLNWSRVFQLNLRKPVLAICEQQRRRSACVSAQSDQPLCCSLPRKYNTFSFQIRNFRPLASFLAAQAGLSHTWSEIPKTGYLVMRLTCSSQQVFGPSQTVRLPRELYLKQKKGGKQNQIINVMLDLPKSLNLFLNLEISLIKVML